ncbi:SDR family oxidoreductase [Sandaracinus amylolyticus]|uniref:SDR family oxidoreductase n=1 Tax=Sandaracinus amylolyticus TaxID=927083 RepID=UPI001EE9B3EB|nr:SDR family oxidoreductase [Sandaracinus amylolyticus]UJR80747.1 Short-chain dehydrogenase [Sandaracinus amylolyticus]
MRDLEGRIAVVAGATRGAGRGIAVALGERGATVYCTGRSVRGAIATSGRSETIDETAERVTAAGGRGIAVRVDHTREDEVRALFGRVEREAGRLDVLVNDVWGGDAKIDFGKTFWELDLAKSAGLIEQAVWSHVITSRHGAPLMVRANRGLIVEVTDGDSLSYRGNLLYDLVKTSVIRLAMGMGYELRRTGIAAVAVTPGFLRSEAMLENFEVSEANWRDAIAKEPDFAVSETPMFVGRCIAALAADPNVTARSGRVYASWTLAREYEIDDVDGTRPDWGAHFASKYGPASPCGEAVYAEVNGGMFATVYPEWPKLSAP